MFAHLFKALFGARAPSALARAAQSRWDAWLQPFPDPSPAGAELRDDDDFQAIKDEVAKLSDLDDTFIIETAQRLLTHRAKDVRLAVYYLYARMRRDGAPGVAEGFELLSALLDRFGEAVLPTRAETRKAALEWLAGATFTLRLERVSSLSGALLERTVSALALIVERTALWPAHACPQLGPLLQRFEARLDALAPLSEPRSVVPSDTPATLPLSVPELSGARELLDRARQMAQFLRAQPCGYLAAYRLMRCVRWDTLTEAPPHDGTGRTRLAPPRPELRSHLKRLLLQQQWPELLERVEQAYCEGANHFWLDLQYYAFAAQDQAGGEYAQIRDLVATDCALMLQRLSGLAHLAFSDGSPFADDTTLEWIARYATVRDVERGQGVVPVALTLGDADWAETEAQARDMVAQQSLEAALAWLQDLPLPPGARQRFVLHLVMARLAEQAERADVALHLLTALETTAQRFELANWEPELAFEVKRQLRSLLSARIHRKDADKPALARRIEALMGELTALDPARAVALI